MFKSYLKSSLKDPWSQEKELESIPLYHMTCDVLLFCLNYKVFIVFYILENRSSDLALEMLERIFKLVLASSTYDRPNHVVNITLSW